MEHKSRYDEASRVRNLARSAAEQIAGALTQALGKQSARAEKQ